ncbi:MAG: hypothetical protein ABII64_10365 [Elusimicrobiota bacterium]
MNVYKAFVLSVLAVALACGSAHSATTLGANVKVKVILGTWDNWSYMSGLTVFWFYGGDASGTTTTGSLYMHWSSTNSTSVYAEVGTADINENWTQYVRIKASVKCSSVNAPIDIVFFDGTNWIGTSAQKVSTANTWQNLEWNLPSGTFSWNAVKKVIFRVRTDTEPSGTFYAENVKLLK